MGTHEADKIVACLIIKPDALVQDEAVEEIFDIIDLNGITILASDVRQLSESEIEAVFPGSSDEYRAHLASGPSRLLALTKGEAGLSIVRLLRDMCGPVEPAMAKEQSPKSLRAKFGADLTLNAVHCSESNREAREEVKALFPELEIPRASASAQLRDDLEKAALVTKIEKEQTVTLIRPSAAKEHTDEIVNIAKESGFDVLKQIQINIDQNMFEKMYGKHQDQDYYQSLEGEMMSGPCVALLLEAPEAVSAWRRLVGPMLDAAENAPDSLRAKFQVGEVNPIHAASNQSQVKLETDMIFNQQEAIKEPEAIEPPLNEPETLEQESVVADEVEEAAVVETPAQEEEKKEEQPEEQPVEEAAPEEPAPEEAQEAAE